MLSLPGIKGLIKNRDGRKQDDGLDPEFFKNRTADLKADMTSYVLYLARGLCLDVLALIETDGGKAARITAAGKLGLTCELTIPTLDDAGPLSQLLGEAEVSGGVGKIFARDEVFPCEATWCDFIPLDSSVAYFFVPLARIPAAGTSALPVERSNVNSFVLAASTGPDNDLGLAIKATAAAGMIDLSRTGCRLIETSQTADAFRNLVKRAGYSLCVVNREGTITERSGTVFSEMKPDTLERLRKAVAELQGRRRKSSRAPHVLTLDESDRFEALVYPIKVPGTPDSFVVVLRPTEAESQRGTGCGARTEQLRLLSRFMSSIAHEIKNPLTGIAAGVQYLAKRLQPGATEDDTVGFVLVEINRLNRIVDDLYRIAKPPDLMLATTSINDVVARSLLSLSERILKKGLSVRQDFQNDIPEFEADADRLQQVLINIIKNAVEASAERAEIHIETAREGSNVVVRITDGGPGIPVEVRERVFEPFYSNKQDGTGLGLCISQRIVDQHGGTIYIEDGPEGGTTFIIQLPVRG
jgi:signal transduction histidine kinase